ncbi:zinc finger CCHC domain-containing protein 2 isoform X3 [Latimeria chalumnae]|uniref:zinc finger CCHC domain-containing protein 2 isoform X3 n=1 Tax=Latimeria chalumnae TaxID=7897 RepID=UPI00313DCD61
MLKMKLLLKSEEGLGDAAGKELREAEVTPDCDLRLPSQFSPSFPSAGCLEEEPPPSYRDVSPEPGAGGRLDKEAVYKWFKLGLPSAQRVDFLYGLLDLCHPLELRFLGACLEDLARKDFHSLREAEVRANSLGDMSQLSDLTQPEVRCKLIVYLALLASDNREVAAVLYGVLRHVDGILKNCGLNRFRPGGQLEGAGIPAAVGGVRGAPQQQQPPPPWPGGLGVDPQEHLLLLFTMASLHPAFAFHHRVTLRAQLDEIYRAVFADRRELYRHNQQNGSDFGQNNGFSERTASPHDTITAAPHKSLREAVHIEKITLKGAPRKRADKHLEYTFEVTWSNYSVSSVTKTHQELQEFLLKLPKEVSTEAFDETILRALYQGSQKREEKRHSDLESAIRQLFLSPSKAFLQSPHVCDFLSISSDSSPPHNIQLHTAVHHKKPVGKSQSANMGSMKYPHLDSFSTHLEQNGGVDWRKKNTTLKHSTDHCGVTENQHLVEDLWNLPSGNKKKVKPLTDKDKSKKVDNRGSTRIIVPNGINRATPVQHIQTVMGKDKRLDVGSGQDTCGETSSESYSSPSSPQSEDEKGKDTDSDSGKEKTSYPAYPNTRPAVISRPATRITPVLNEDGSILEDPLNPSKFPQMPYMPTVSCVVQNGAQKPEAVLPHAVPTDLKHVGLFLRAPMSVSPMRDSVPVGIGAASVTESEKRLELMSSSLPVSAHFLSQPLSSGSPASHSVVQRFKVVQPNSESCTVLGPQPPVGNITIGSPSTTFLSFHNSMHNAVAQGNFLGSSGPNADPSTKSATQGGVGLTSFGPSSATFGLPGAAVPTSALPPQNTNVLNTAAATSPPPPLPPLSAVGQVQQTVLPVVPTHTPGPAPCPSPALTHSTAQSDSTSYINAVGSTSTNGTIPPPQQLGCGACSSCGCRGSCGTNGNLPGNYYYSPHLHGQLIRFQHVYPMASLCTGSYLNQTHQGNGTPVSFLLAQAPYSNGLMHEPLLGSQTNYGVQQLPNYGRLLPPMFQPPNLMASSSGSGPKKNGNISCYNCGAGGHYAYDCKQPSMEASQQSWKFN